MQVNITKRGLFFILGVVVLLAGGFAVYAYGTSAPATFGHSINEIDGITCTAGQAVTRTASGWSCVNVGSGGSASTGTVVGGGYLRGNCFSLWGVASCTGQQGTQQFVCAAGTTKRAIVLDCSGIVGCPGSDAYLCIQN